MAVTAYSALFCSMVEQENLQEIQEMGETEEWTEQSEPNRRGGSILPLLQAAICAAALLLLLILKYTDAEEYQKVSGWYQDTVSQEIQLPRFDKSEESQPEGMASSESKKTNHFLDGGIQEI